MKFIIRIGILTGTILTSPIFARSEITLYSPYDFEPFLIDADKEAGLMFDLQRALNQRQSPDFHFNVKYLPRARLIYSFEQLHDCAVPFVSPAWFDDPQMKTYAWTSSLYDDENVILSPRHTPIDTLDGTALQGKNTQTVLGHKDPVLDSLIEKGIVLSNKTTSLRNTVQMVAKGRLDFIVSGRLILNYLVNTMQVQDTVYFGKNPTQRFERRILLCKDTSLKLLTWLRKQAEDLPKDTKWKKIMRLYQNPETSSLTRGI